MTRTTSTARAVSQANNESPYSPVAIATALASTSPPATDYTLWVGLGIVLVVLAMAVLFWVRRRP